MSTQEAGRRTKRAAILDAARMVFLRDGYDLAAMDVIAREAEVSKQTIYNNFGDKESLFQAFVESRCTALRDTIEAASPDDVNASPRDVLTAYGKSILAVMVSGEAMRMKRLLETEGRNYPPLARIFYRQGPDVMIEKLAAYLARQSAQGTLVIADPRMAAEQFVAMLPGHLRLRHLIGMASRPPGQAEQDRYVHNAVTLFLEGACPR